MKENMINIKNKGYSIIPTEYLFPNMLNIESTIEKTI